MVRSLNVPGSPSAALTMTVDGASGEWLAATVSHLRPVGKPAPPRPRRPEARTRSMIAAGVIPRAASIPVPPPRVRYSWRDMIGDGYSTR